MNTAYLLIGGNMGDRLTVLTEARKKIAESCGPIVMQSAIYQTAAWGLEEQDDFLNQVIQVKTTLTANALLQTILAIEKAFGRQRDVMYGPRTLDIDILFFNQDSIRQEHLVIPHPRLQDRRFVLVPLAEIAPRLVHPVLGKTVSELLQACADPLSVQKFQ